MKDEVLELLAPDLLSRYRRWRPWLTALIGFAIIPSVVASIVMIVRGQDCELRSLITVLLYGSLAVGILQIVLDRRLTRSISGMGSQFSTRLRHFLMAAWMTAFVLGLAVEDGVYRPHEQQKTGVYKCRR